MKLDSLKKLYIEELKDLYSAEKQLLKALPKMAKCASNEDLKSALKKHLGETQLQANRLEKLFKEMKISGNGKVCTAMKGLIEEASELMEESGDPAVIDAGLVAAAQRVEHYEMAGYGTAKAFAECLDEKTAVTLLQQTLDEEREANVKLTNLAKTVINLEASKIGGEDRSKVNKNIGFRTKMAGKNRTELTPNSP